MDDRAILVIGAVLELASLAAAASLWRRPGRAVGKALWTAVVLVPFVGLVAYLVWHDLPPPSDPVDRPPERDWDVPPRP